ncbi:MAG TPA: LysR family transcriptional regulator [Solimonas sp.]|nr:LysR family transcriptional regulator [Solimonas sp.]
MEDLNYVLTFTRVVQSGSFAAAGQRLKLAPSVVSKHVAKLEKTLGARLLQRSTRKLSLTDAGSAYFEHCARIVEELEQSQHAIARLQAEPSGKLRITSLNSFVDAVVAPLLPEFLQRYPKIEVEIVTNDRIVDLAEEGFDLALRMTHAPGPLLVARKLAPLHFVVCATPEYLARHGTPQHPDDLRQHNCLGFPSPLERNFHFQRNGETFTVPIDGNFRVNNINVLRTLLLNHVGISLLPTYAIGQDLAAGRLVAPLRGWYGADTTAVYAVHLPNRYGSPKMRAFTDYLIQRIGDPPYWDRGLDLQ